jgi:polyhydroxyalkanoate synthesis regulator phasin
MTRSALPRLLTLTAAACLAALLPVVAQAQEPDYEAVGDRLLEAVEEGELSPAQAKAMMAALAAARFEERLAAHREEVERHEEHDEWEEAFQKLEARWEALGLGGERLARVVHGLEESGIEGERLLETLEAMAKLVHMILKDEVDGEAKQRFHAYFREDLDLNEDQIEVVGGMAHRIAGHLAEQRGKAPAHGSTKADAAAVKKRLMEAVKAGKITEEQAKERYAAWEARRSASGKAGREPEIAEHFARLGIDGETLGKVKHSLLEGGLPKQHLEGVLKSLLAMIPEMRAKGEAWKLHPNLRGYLQKKVGLDYAQLERLVHLARRLAAVKKRSNPY